MSIRDAAVLGAGVMGAQIAAHFANAGVRVRLLDVSREAARDGLARAVRLKPDPFFTAGVASLIQIGSFDDDLPSIGSAASISRPVVHASPAKKALRPPRGTGPSPATDATSHRCRQRL